MGFFSRKPQPKLKGLEQAKEMNLITEEEFLKLKVARAEKEYEKYTTRKSGSKTKIKRSRKK